MSAIRRAAGLGLVPALALTACSGWSASQPSSTSTSTTSSTTASASSTSARRTSSGTAQELTGRAVARGPLEKDLSEIIARQAQVQARSIACPGPLPAEVGATLECTLSASDGTVPVTVTVEQVDQDDVSYSARVGSAEDSENANSTSAGSESAKTRVTEPAEPAS